MKNKLLKKVLGIFEYKLIDKNLFKNNRLLSDKSFLTINIILKNIFEKKKINNLIQIGANDGDRFDILNYYIKKYQTQSLLVEPIKKNFEQLKKNYKNYNFITFDNSAISVNNEISYLYKVDSLKIKNYDNHIPGITSFDKNHLIKHGVKKSHIIREIVNSISIKELIEKHNFIEFELLFLDTEGYDGKIINDFFLNLTIRPIIILEYVHINNEIFKKLVTNLEKNKYLFFSINENMLCFPEEKKELINFN